MKKIYIWIILIFIGGLCLFFIFRRLTKNNFKSISESLNRDEQRYNNLISLYQLNNYPLISAVCITRKRVPFLKRVIRDFFDQTYPNKEIVIVFDSDDNDTKQMLGT